MTSLYWYYITSLYIIKHQLRVTQFHYSPFINTLLFNQFIINQFTINLTILILRLAHQTGFRIRVILLPAWLLHIIFYVYIQYCSIKHIQYKWNLVVVLIQLDIFWLYISWLLDGLPVVKVNILSLLSSQHLYVTQSSSPSNRTHSMIVGPLCINLH